MFYILLCLKRECCGMDIMDRVPAMTAGRVKVGPGTLYNLLDQFLEADMIRQTGMDGRRIRYILTQKGIEALQTEYQRLQWQMRDFDRVMGKEGP
jgi:DNA-binding PadR family transcriptional regulator